MDSWTKRVLNERSHSPSRRSEAMPEMPSLDPNVHEAGEPISHRQTSSNKPYTEDCELQAFETAFVRRKSAPVARRTSVGVGETPESILTRTTVQITSFVERGDHCVYTIEVDTGLDTHIVYKRFSEIRAFRKKLFGGDADTTGHGVCTQLAQVSEVKFPSRRIRIPSICSTNMGAAADRMLPLQTFLQSLLHVFRLTTRRNMRLCVNANCATIALIRSFLEVDEPTPGSYKESTADVDSTERDLLAALQELEEEKAEYVVPVCLPGDKLGTMVKRDSLFAISEDVDPVSVH